MTKQQIVDKIDTLRNKIEQLNSENDNQELEIDWECNYLDGVLEKLYTRIISGEVTEDMATKQVKNAERRCNLIDRALSNRENYKYLYSLTDKSLWIEQAVKRKPFGNALMQIDTRYQREIDFQQALYIKNQFFDGLATHREYYSSVDELNKKLGTRYKAFEEVSIILITIAIDLDLKRSYDRLLKAKNDIGTLLEKHQYGVYGRTIKSVPSFGMLMGIIGYDLIKYINICSVLTLPWCDLESYLANKLPNAKFNEKVLLKLGLTQVKTYNGFGFLQRAAVQF